MVVEDPQGDAEGRRDLSGFVRHPHHSQAGVIRVHHAKLRPDQSLANPTRNSHRRSADHDEMSVRKQRFLLDAIHGSTISPTTCASGQQPAHRCWRRTRAFRTGRSVEM